MKNLVDYIIENMKYEPLTDELSEKIRKWCETNLIGGYPDDNTKPAKEGQHYIITKNHSIANGPGITSLSGSSIFYVNPKCTEFPDYISFADTKHFEATNILGKLKQEQLPQHANSIFIDSSIKTIPSCELTIHSFGIRLADKKRELTHIDNGLILNFIKSTPNRLNNLQLQNSEINIDDIKNIKTTGTVDCVNLHNTPVADEINQWLKKHKKNEKSYSTVNATATISDSEYLDDIFKGFDLSKKINIKLSENNKTQTIITKTQGKWTWRRLGARYVIK